jgi:hypothetical protein
MVGLNDMIQELNPGCDFSLDNAVAAAKNRRTTNSKAVHLVKRRCSFFDKVFLLFRAGLLCKFFKHQSVVIEHFISRGNIITADIPYDSCAVLPPSLSRPSVFGRYGVGQCPAVDSAHIFPVPYLLIL